MIDLTNINKVFLFTEPIDFRYGINALGAIVLKNLQTNKAPYSSLFMFINKKHTQVKIIEFEATGLWLYTKKLNNSKFVYPNNNTECKLFKISNDNLKTILTGLDFIKKIEGDIVNEYHFY